MARGSLLVSDLDGTLIGDEPALRRFSAWFEARRDRMLLAYASGRFYSSVEATVREWRLPEPDVVIGGVGSEICRYPSSTRIWPAEQEELDHWDAGQVMKLLSDVPDLRLQPDEFQSAYKVSYYLEGARPRDVEEIDRTLRNASIQADIIYSSNRDLDVLPGGVNKGSAVDRLVQWTGLERRDVIVAGDTGNDLSMFEHGFRGIVVANAEPVLRSLSGDTVYHARGRFAAGVLEGVRHWLSEQDRDEPTGSSIPKGHRRPAHERHR